MARLMWISAVPLLCCVFLFRVADAHPGTESMSLNRPASSLVQSDILTKLNSASQATSATVDKTNATTQAPNTTAHTTNATTHAPNTTAHTTTNTTTHAPNTTAHTTTNTTTHAPNTTAHTTTNTTTHAPNTTAHTTNTTTHAPNTTAHTTTNTTTHAPNTTAHTTTNTTTHAPNTTAHTTINTTTHAPNTTAHTTTNTTTLAPNTTAHTTTNTTTHTLNTTTSSYTTQPTPTLVPKPSPPTVGLYTVKDEKNATCIKASVGLELQLYHSSKVEGYYNIIPTETTTDGTCGDSTANLKVSFPGGFIEFGFVTDQGYYYIKDIDVLFKLASETWTVSTTNEKLLYTKRGNSVTCKNTPTTKIKDSVGLVMANVKLQAFNFTSEEFGKEQRCSYDTNVIAVAVGVTVVIVIIIIIIVYLIWRKKKSSGYERI